MYKRQGLEAPDELPESAWALKGTDKPSAGRFENMDLTEG